jgi:regulator of replication initiation timing
MAEHLYSDDPKRSSSSRFSRTVRKLPVSGGHETARNNGRVRESLRPAPAVQVIGNPDVLFTKLETLKTENDGLRKRLDDAREKAEALQAENKELKTRISSVPSPSPARKKNGKELETDALSLTKIRTLLAEIKKTLTPILDANFPLGSASAPVSKGQKTGTDPLMAEETTLDDPALKRFQELKGLYRLPMTISERMQTELAFVRGQRTQALEVVREMQGLLSSLGEEHHQLKERVSRSIKILDKFLDNPKR